MGIFLLNIFIAAFVYEVELGDSLYRISRRFGTPMSELIRTNRDRQGLSHSRFGGASCHFLIDQKITRLPALIGSRVERNGQDC